MKMKIEYAPQEEKRNFTFEELEVGDIFQSTVRKSIYMKMFPETTKAGEGLNAVALTMPILAVSFENDEEVFPFEAKLTIGREIKK